MPEIKHYDGKKKHSTKTQAAKKGSHHASHSKPHAAKKRRPHHDMAADKHHEDETVKLAEAVLEDTEAINTEAANEGITKEEIFVAEVISEEDTNHGHPDRSDIGEERLKVHLDFYGSELLRQKAPKVMEVADTVADEWMHDGNFEGLPVGNPLAQIAAAKALRTAKDVEKKLEEKGVITMAKMGLDYVKSKIEKRNT
ncbi:hypothetical protein [Bdellovibrio reynosensis]|uniref:Uncharacterized protein n=1 Tax=Bdellovibrio reynosensis TaxID=2835041 RepID=A0ABY4CCS3_9BACT|nr:hypothetical protein [Bdellovibrio reynosensis]UOF02584.1 hypothetical protein MNR06_06420 [Bdellovibrio reynosensis]